LLRRLGGSGSFLCNTNFFNKGYATEDTIRRNWNVANKVGTSSVTPFIYKYRDAQWVAGSNNSRMNWIVIRYADILLMQSEAMNNLTPTDPAKFNGINAVRTRAGMISPTQQYSFTNVPTQSAFVDTLVAERGRELCVEGHRRWDLIRLGRYKQIETSIGFTLEVSRIGTREAAALDFTADVTAGSVRAVSIGPAGQVTGQLAGGRPFSATIPAVLGGNGLAGLHLWSLDRDTPCATTTTYASPTCNSVSGTTALEYTNRFLSDLGN